MKTVEMQLQKRNSMTAGQLSKLSKVGNPGEIVKLHLVLKNQADYENSYFKAKLQSLSKSLNVGTDADKIKVTHSWVTGNEQFGIVTGAKGMLKPYFVLSITKDHQSNNTGKSIYLAFFGALTPKNSIVKAAQYLLSKDTISEQDVKNINKIVNPFQIGYNTIFGGLAVACLGLLAKYNEDYLTSLQYKKDDNNT